MSKQLIIALAQAATALANASLHLATSLDGDSTSAAPETVTTNTTEAPVEGAKRRGRPAKTEEPEAPAEPKITDDELKELIKPIIESEGGGEKVKEIVSKYTDGKMVTIEQKDRPAFVKKIKVLKDEIEALSI